MFSFSLDVQRQTKWKATPLTEGKDGEEQTRSFYLIKKKKPSAVDANFFHCDLTL